MLAGLGLAVGVFLFASLQYHQAQHRTTSELFARPSLGAILAPSIAMLTIPLVICARPRARRRLLAALAPAGVAAIPLFILQHLDPLNAAVFLYAWLALLAWCAWRASPLVRIADLSKRTAHWCTLIAVVLMVAIQLRMQYNLWFALSFGYHDIGLFARALHNAALGRGLWVDSLGHSILGEHSSLALWTLVPFCKLGVPPLHLLMLASAVCLSAPAFIVARYARRVLDSNWAGLVAALAWLLHPSLTSLVVAHGYGFHEIYLAMPLFVAGLACTLERRWGPAALCMMLTLFVREDAALSVAVWGVYVAVACRQRVLGGVVFALSVCYLFACVRLLVPWARGSPYPHIAHNFANVLQVITSPRMAWYNFSFLLTTLLPMALLPLRRPGLALAALPALLETMLSSNADLHNLAFHYYTPALAFLFFAAIEAWRDLAHPRAVSVVAAKRLPRRLVRPGICLMVAALFGHAYLGVGPLTNNPAEPVSPPSLRDKFAPIRLLRDASPRTASVTASYRIAAQFLDFDRLWTVRNARDADLVVVDDRDNWDGGHPREALIRAHRIGGYQPAYADYHLVALARERNVSPLTVELRPGTIPKECVRRSLDLGAGIELVGMRVTPSVDGSREGARGIAYRVVLVWRCGTTPAGDVRFGLTTERTRTRWGPFYFARGAYPTCVWKPAELYRDELEIEMSPDDASHSQELTPILLK